MDGVGKMGGVQTELWCRDIEPQLVKRMYDNLRSLNFRNDQ